MKISDFLDKIVQGEIALEKIIPFWGQLNQEQKMDFICKLAGSIAKGTAEGAVKGKNSN